MKVRLTIWAHNGSYHEVSFFSSGENAVDYLMKVNLPLTYHIRINASR